MEEQKKRESFKINITSPDPGYEPFPVAIMNRSSHEAVSFDPALGKPAVISYSLNKAGCIRIRIVRRELPELIIRTLQDWTVQDFAKHELTWDGRDALGNIVDNKKIQVLFEAQDQGKGRQHGGHPKETCVDPRILLDIGRPHGGKASGPVQITTLFSGAARGMDENGYEVRYYLDYLLHKTEKFEKGTREFRTTLDTTLFENGERYLIVNVDDGHDHIGSAGILLPVDNQGARREG